MWYGFHGSASGRSDGWQGLSGAVVMCRCLGHGRKVGGGKLPVCSALPGRAGQTAFMYTPHQFCAPRASTVRQLMQAWWPAAQSRRPAWVWLGGRRGSTLQHAHSYWPSRGRHTWPVGCFHPACTCHCSCSLRAGKHPCRPVWQLPPPPPPTSRCSHTAGPLHCLAGVVGAVWGSVSGRGCCTPCSLQPCCHHTSSGCRAWQGVASQHVAGWPHMLTAWLAQAHGCCYRRVAPV